MLPNKPYKGNQIPNQPFYTPEDPATFDRLSGVLTPNIQLEPNPSEIGSFAKWERPTDWLPLLAPAETEEKFKGLFAIYDIDTNFLAFTFEGDYVVDWGDGSIEYFNSGEKAQHSYQWSKVAFGTLTSEGFRQVVVTVTPQRGNHLTSMDLSTFHDNLGLGSWQYIQVPWMDIALSMPQADSGASIRFGTTDTVSMSVLERVTIVHSGGATDFSYLVEYNCRNLGEFNLFNAPYVEDFTEVFYACFNLKNVNIGDLPNVYVMDFLFQDCHSLEHVELSGLNSADSFGNIFYGCESLKSVKMSGLTSANSGLGSLMDSYTSLPHTRSLTLEDLNSVSSLGSSFPNFDWDLRGHLKLTGLVNADLNSGLQNNYALESVELSDLENCTDAYQLFSDCYSLKTVKLNGTENLENTSYMFGSCYSLEEAPLFDTSSVQYMYDMFEFCHTLQNVPLYNTSNVVDMDYMFYYCYSLQSVPHFDTSSNEYFYDMFEGCYSLETVPLFNTSSSNGDFDTMFSDCYSLQKLPKLDVSSGTNLGNIVSLCSCLAAAPLQGTSTDISFNGCCLSRNAILDIFNGLANASATIDVSYNYGADDLTSEDIAIAEGKGWTVIY